MPEIFKKNLNEKMYNAVAVSGYNTRTATGDISKYTITNITNTSNTSSSNSIKKYYPKKNSKMPYLLRDIMKCECCGSVLTPVFTTKKKSGIVYRYYKPNKAIKHSSNDCRAGNIPAEQIENIILNQVYSLLKSPIVVSGVIDKFKSDDLAIHIKESDIIKYLKNIEVVWNELFPKEQMEIIRALINEIVISDSNLKIKFNCGGVLKLLADAGQFDIDLVNKMTSVTSVTSIDSSDSSLNNDNRVYEVNIPVDFRSRSGRSFITTPSGRDISFINANSRGDGNNSSSSNANDDAVVFALIQAESWRQELEISYLNKKNNNCTINISSIATRECKINSYICRRLNLVFLAPDIKKAILTRTAPLGLSLLDLYNCMDFDWVEQRKRLGIRNLA